MAALAGDVYSNDWLERCQGRYAPETFCCTSINGSHSLAYVYLVSVEYLLLDYLLKISTDFIAS